MKKIIKDKLEAALLVEELSKENKYALDVVLLPEDQGYQVQWIEQKQYIGFDGTIRKDECWITIDNELLMVQDMSEAHAKNALRLMISNQRQDIARTNAFMKQLAESVSEDEEPMEESPEPARVLH